MIRLLSNSEREFDQGHLYRNISILTYDPQDLMLEKSVPGRGHGSESGAMSDIVGKEIHKVLPASGRDHV